jgi:hypothetical protein
MARLSSDRAETGTASRLRSSRIVAVIGIFLFWWILTALVYRHTESNFLRAESGWYLFLSHSDPAVQHHFEKVLLTKSFYGHYAPLGFLGEFATAKLAGTHAWFWKWRQITALALLATILFLVVRNSGCALNGSRLNSSLAATGLTAILIFQALMRDFVAWPFMILQLLWLLFSLLALMSLVQMAQRPSEKTWAWFAAAAAYVSLQFLGLGIATVGATAVCMSGIWWIIRRSSPGDAARIRAPLLSLIAIATLHAVVTLKFPHTEIAVASAESRPLPFLIASLGFVPNFALAILRSLFNASGLTLDGWPSTQAWPYGLAILLGFGFLLGHSFFRCRRQGTARNRTRFILRTFAVVSFLTIIALMMFRQWRDPSPEGFALYLIAPRSLLPATFALAGIFAELLFLVASAPVLLNAILNLALGVCAISANLQFAANVYPKVMPRSVISHDRAWQSIVAMARECRSADLAIPDVPLGALVQEFPDWDLKMFEPLLRADLNLPETTSLKVAPWTAFTGESPDEYRRQVPSLAEVKERLGLAAKN